jgi:hypothetical protein
MHSFGEGTQTQIQSSVEIGFDLEITHFDYLDSKESQKSEPGTSVLVINIFMGSWVV